MSPQLIVTVFVLLSACPYSWGYKVLLYPMPASSHIFSFYHIGRGLMERGHEVHLLINWGWKVPEKWTQKSSDGGGFIVHIYGNNSGSNTKMEEVAIKMTMELMFNNFDIEYIIKMMKYVTGFASKEFFEGNDELMKRLVELKFDAAVVDTIFFMRFTSLLATRLKLPLISYMDAVEPWLIRMPWLPSVHTTLNFYVEENNGFYQRLLKTFLLIRIELFPLFQDPDDEILDKFRKYEHFGNIKDVIRNSVLFLTTEDPVLDPIRPYTANVISVGGLTTESLKRLSPLPEDYLNFIQASDDRNTNAGTIVVSFGSLVPKYPERLAKIFLTAFGTLLQYRFIWRFENFLNLSIPKNVKIVSWLPQKELLGHPSVKLFITHSGNNGQFEALYFGIPMLAIPLFGDQPKNAKRIVERGYGEELDFRTLDVDQLMNSIEKIIRNSSYKEKITKASDIFRSRPDTPAQRAAFWIEHVIRFGGDHLKPAGNDLTFWEYLCLDVLVFLNISIVFLLAFLIAVFRKVIKKLFHKSFVEIANKKHN